MNFFSSVMTFEARDKAAKICPEDPPKKFKDELCVNVIKNLVRKYSGVPKSKFFHVFSITLDEKKAHHSDIHMSDILNTNSILMLFQYL